MGKVFGKIGAYCDLEGRQVHSKLITLEGETGKEDVNRMVTSEHIC